MSRHAALRRWGYRLLGLAAGVALAYPLSLGPACWTLSWVRWDRDRPQVAFTVSCAYEPLAPMVVFGPEPVRGVMRWWLGVGMPPWTEFHGDWPQGVGWSNPGYTYTLWHY